MRLLDKENIGGRIEKWWLHTGDDGEDRITVETVQDVEPILDANKRAFNDAPRSYDKSGMTKVADIPATVIEETCRIKGIPFREFVAAKTDRAQAAWRELLNAREFRAFRTRPGRVDVR